MKKLIGVVIYIGVIALMICNPQQVKKVVEHITQGSTTYCYQNDVDNAWWQTR